MSIVVLFEGQLYYPMEYYSKHAWKINTYLEAVIKQLVITDHVIVPPRKWDAYTTEVDITKKRERNRLVVIS